MTARLRSTVASAAAALAVALAVALPAAPAAAGAPTLVVSGVTAEPGVVRFTLTARDLLASARLEPAAVRVRVEGTPLATVALAASALPADAPARAVMAVLDATSRVPVGELDAARAAIAGLARDLPADVRLGLVTLTTRTPAVIPPTTDRTSITQALAGVVPGGTATLSAGVTAALDALRGAKLDRSQDRRLFILADGLNTSAALTDAAKAALAADPVPVDVVAYGAGSSGTARLLAYATASGGRLLAAPSKAVAVTAATTAAAAFGPALAVTVTVPVGLAGRGSTLDISVEGTTMSAVAPVTFPASAVAAAGPPRSTLGAVPSWLAYIFALLVFAAMVTVVLTLAWPRALPNQRINQIAHFGPARTRAAPKVEPGSAVAVIARTALQATASVVGSGGLQARIALRLERASMRLQPAEWVLLRVLVTLGGGVALFILIGLPGVVLGPALGWLSTVAYQTVRVDRRANQFADQLPDALQLVIGSLKSGFSLPQALESLVRESPEPVGAEFGRALAEHRLGVDVSDALERVAQRTGSDDLGWAVMAVRIQREVGGNLAEVLQTTVDTMRERARLRRHVRSLSAEGRLSAWVLIALPLSLGLFMFVFRRSYMTPLVTDSIGVIMLVGGSLLFLLGIIWLTRVIKVEA